MIHLQSSLAYQHYACDRFRHHPTLRRWIADWQLADKIREVYQETYTRTELGNVEIPGGLKGNCPASERAWLLKPRA